MLHDNRLLDLLGIELPVIQAPMAGSDSPVLAAAVSAAGGLGSIGCAVHGVEDVAAIVRDIRRATNRPFNLNFFCHQPPRPEPAGEAAWLDCLSAYFAELGIKPPDRLTAGRSPFDESLCVLLEEMRPQVVSFHFGLPPDPLLERVKAAGCRVLCSATTPEEAVGLADRGVDAIVAQGSEAGGHRGTFGEDWRSGSGMIGTLSLVPQIVDAVDLPVIAAGGIADGRGIAACAALGASAVQIGTAYLFTPESAVSPLYRRALAAGRSSDTRLTNVMTGRPARGLLNRLMRETGPMSDAAPAFPLAATASGPLRAAAEAQGSPDFSSLWAGQSVGLGRALPAGDLTRLLVREAEERLTALGGISG